MAPAGEKTKSASQEAFEYFTKKLAFLFPPNKSPVYLSRVAPDEEDEELLRPVWDNTPISINMVDCCTILWKSTLFKILRQKVGGSNETALV